jgi:hypothetical protein
MTKPKRKRKIWKTLGITLGVLVTFVLLFVVAFVFNPLEGTLPDVRDVVPRDVNFFVRKERLASDFDEFPAPKFWTELTDSRGWQSLKGGPIVQGLQRDGLERSLLQARESLERVRKDSGGWIDVMRDGIGKEVVFAGYQQDYRAAAAAACPTVVVPLHARQLAYQSRPRRRGPRHRAGAVAARWHRTHERRRSARLEDGG